MHKGEALSCLLPFGGTPAWQAGRKLQIKPQDLQLEDPQVDGDVKDPSLRSTWLAIAASPS